MAENDSEWLQLWPYAILMIVIASWVLYHFLAPESWRDWAGAGLVQAFKTRSTPKCTAIIRMSEGLTAINTVKEIMANSGRPRDNLYEVALWEDLVTVRDDEAFYAYMVDNQAIVIHETIDAIRALTGRQRDLGASIAKVNTALGVGVPFA